MVSEITIEEAFQLNLPIIDVRSPGEYEKGHIPNAHNIPLFSNDERAHVGTVYKKQSKEVAIKIGYKYVNPKLDFFVKSSEEISNKKGVVIHCWRGGMRSRSFAEHISENGIPNVKVITGGYKAFRNYVLNTFETQANLMVLGGYTGSGKTHILKYLKNNGHQIIDLEFHANHKGSAFGGIGLAKQPSTEQFENNLFMEWKNKDFSRPIWIEDESHNIGGVKVPMPLFLQIRSSKLYFIRIPKEERAKHLVEEYANIDKNYLKESIERISKRLGGLNVKKSLEYIEQGNYYNVALIALQYYDKSYERGMQSRDEIKVIDIPLLDTNHKLNASILGKQL